MANEADHPQNPVLRTAKIGVFVGFFVPGYKSGGPIRSLDALTKVDNKDAHFYVITSDRDRGDLRPYSVARPGRWVNSPSRSVLYVNVRSLRATVSAARTVRSQNIDLYYLNSLWSPVFTLLPLVLMCLRLLPRRPVVLAPRGEVLPEAMARRSLKKQFMWPFVRRMLDILQPTFHCTFHAEAQALRRMLPRVPILTIGDSFDAASQDTLTDPTDEDAETGLRLLFLSRIHPHKNLLGALRSLKQVENQVDFRVVGSVADPGYYEECVKFSEQLPENIKVTFLGPVPHDAVRRHMHWADAFILPTKSENFGHVIREALEAGCIIVTSETTPWEDLLNRVGCFPIAWRDEAGYSQRIVELCTMSPEARKQTSQQVALAYHDWEALNKSSGFDLSVQLVRLAVES